MCSHMNSIVYNFYAVQFSRTTNDKRDLTLQMAAAGHCYSSVERQIVISCVQPVPVSHCPSVSPNSSFSRVSPQRSVSLFFVRFISRP